jgi:hypothetical protein
MQARHVREAGKVGKAGRQGRQAREAGKGGTTREAGKGEAGKGKQTRGAKKGGGGKERKRCNDVGEVAGIGLRITRGRGHKDSNLEPLREAYLVPPRANVNEAPFINSETIFKFCPREATSRKLFSK